MTDLHTHILPGMDDGARNVEESLAMLRMEREQGVDTVVLTPHFLRSKEQSEHFLVRRAAAYETLCSAITELPAEEQEKLPHLVLGAEVAWVPGLMDWDCLPELCLGSSHNLLLELPFTPWNDDLTHQLYALMDRTGITPVIAHMERYIRLQPANRFAEIEELGLPIQLSSDVLLHPFTRRKGLRLLTKRQAHLIASDCHHTDRRVPNLGPAAAVLAKKLVPDEAAGILQMAEDLLR